MSVQLSKKSISVAGGSFLFALTTGVAVLFGIGGANASQTEVCTVEKPVTSVDLNGNNSIVWETKGNCTGVAVKFYMVHPDGSEQLLQKDDVSEDGYASFTYGVIPAGLTYDFRIQGSTENTKTPVSLLVLKG